MDESNRDLESESLTPFSVMIAFFEVPRHSAGSSYVRTYVRHYKRAQNMVLPLDAIFSY
jgi:hypothetical protein